MSQQTLSLQWSCLFTCDLLTLLHLHHLPERVRVGEERSELIRLHHLADLRAHPSELRVRGNDLTEDGKSK
jgi:hypothetical protein